MIRLLKLPNNDWRKTIFLAFSVALLSAGFVSSTHLLLKPQREKNISEFQQERLASMLQGIEGLDNSLFESGIDSLTQKVVNLETGWFTDDINAEEIDMVLFSNDPTLSIELPAEADTAELSRRSNYAPVYLLNSNDELAYLILPIFGTGYQSLIKAWLVLGKDLNTVQALTIIEQNETPGLGSKITDESWQSRFSGKTLTDEQGKLILAVSKQGTASELEVDGIAGATRTGNGISNMITFWFSEYGYRPFLDRLASGG